MEVDEPMEEDPPPAPQPEHQRVQRRGSMSEGEERTRRASIKAILKDHSIPDVERRRSIQQLMDGRRTSIGGGGCMTPPEPDLRAMQHNPANAMHNSSSFLNQPVPSADLLQDSFTCLSMATVSNEQTKRAELTRPLCSHYERNCTMIAPCCGAAFGCRICHDDCPILPPKVTIQQARRRYPRSSSLPSSFTNMNQTPEDTHHTIDRFAVREVICRQCFTRQMGKT